MAAWPRARPSSARYSSRGTRSAAGSKRTSSDAIGKPVPNIEDPRQLLSQISDRPRPIGVGPVARHWQPRVSYAGTYDDAWRRQRAPLWPTRLRRAFFLQRAELSAGVSALDWRRAGAAAGVCIPTGPIRFRLPVLRLASLSRFIGRTVRLHSRARRRADRDRRESADDVLPRGRACAALADQASPDVAAPAAAG